MIEPHGGVPLQFMGDGAMVVFGVPRPGPGVAAAALAAARDLAADISGWNHELCATGAAPLAIGIGIHHGPVVITLLGGRTQVQLTAAGDTVNVASRLLDGFTELPTQEIRGREGRLSVWVVRDLVSARPAGTATPSA